MTIACSCGDCRQSDRAATTPRACPAHFIRDSYARVNECSRILVTADIHPAITNKLERSLYEIADQAFVIAQVEDRLTRIDQIRLLELEKLVGKMLASIYDLSQRQNSTVQQTHSSCSAA